MNKISRLTALLLALTMILSTFAAAETSYQIGQMTTEQWQQMVEQAENELYVIEPGDSGETVMPEIPDKPVQGEFAPYADATKTTLNVSEETVAAVRTTYGVAVLAHSGAGQWQMLVGDVWADLPGEDGTELWVTPEMMHGMTTAEFRKALADETFTQTAKVTVQEKNPVLMAAVRAEEGINEDAADTSVDPFSLQRANEGLEKHLITINYLFQNNNEVAANPYYAEISTTTATFSATVKHPTIVGYQPVVIPAEDMPAGFACNDAQITIDDASIENDVTITVYYEPAEVVYTINYWEEKAVYTFDPATNEEVKYELKATRTDKGLTGSTVKASSPNPDTEQYWAKQHAPEGFMALLYDENVKIAADGSTVIDVYYQRLYTLIVFNLGGGYGVNPIYAKYGTAVGNIGTAVRTGYRPVGWTKDKDATRYVDGYDESKMVALPTTVPVDNVTYYAVWQPLTVYYTIAYWLEDPNWKEGMNPNKRYAYLGQATDTELAGAMTNVAAHQELPSKIQNDLTTQKVIDHVEHASNSADVEVAGDGSTIVNVYYNRKEYKLRFYYAMSHEVDGKTEYRVVGGTTYYFGSDGNGNVKFDEIKLLQQFSNGWHTNRTNQTGAVDSEIALKPNVNVYATGSETVEGDPYEYHYIQFSAKYGADISAMWPVDVFMPVETDVNKNYWSGENAFVAGWNGEYCVWYSQKNDNETIKGAYTVLDYQLLWDYEQFGQYGDGENDNEVAFLCFWENGANINWSIPELYRYHIYVEALPDQAEDPTDVVYRNKRYVRRDWYDTVDDSDPAQQTEPSIEGFTGLATRGGGNKLTGGYDSVQVVKILKAQHNGYKDVTSVYERATIENGKLTAANAQKFATIEEEISNLEIYAGEDTSDRDGDGDIEPNEREPLYNDAYFMYFYYDRQKFNLVKINGGADPVTTTLMYEQSLTGLGDTPDYPGDQAQKDNYRFDGWYTSATFEQGTEVNFETATMPASHLTIYAHWVPITHEVKVYWNKEDAAAGGAAKWTFPEVRHNMSTASSYTFDNPNHFDPDSTGFEEPKQEGLTFTYWFYIKDGKEEPFSFNNTPITEDTVVYAGWTADSLADYTIYYVLAGTAADKVTDEANWVAAPTYGSGLAGATTTERAKGGEELYAGYQTGFFPTLESHSFTLNVDASKNVYVFEYVSVESVPYKVQYLEAGTNNVLAPEKIVTENNKAVVTENYVQIGDNYVPDAFQKRLVLKANSTLDENVIVFYYTKELTSTTLEVNHFLVHADGSKTLHDSVKQIVNDLPEEITVETITVPYYAYDQVRSERFDGTSMVNSFNGLNFTLEYGAAGVVLNLYYVEETVTINYVAVGPTDATNFGTVTQTTQTVGKVTGMPSSTAEAGDGYKFVGWYSDAACTVRAGTDAVFVPAKENGVHVAATYYAKFEHLPGQLDITKVLVNNTEEDIQQTEFTFNVTLTDVNGHPLAGNVEYSIGGQTYTAALQEGKFSLTLDVGTVTGTTTRASATASIADLPYGVQYVVKETPVDNCSVTMENDSGSIRAAETVTATITNNFPAATVSSLTVKKEDMSNGESAIFEVKLDTGYTYMLVLNSAKPSETIVNLPIDSTYTVMELNSWSWRYADQKPKTGTIRKDGNVVTFTNTRTNTAWMSDESWVENNATEGKEINSLNNQ